MYAFAPQAEACGHTEAKQKRQAHTGDSDCSEVVEMLTCDKKIPRPWKMPEMFVFEVLHAMVRALYHMDTGGRGRGILSCPDLV